MKALFCYDGPLSVDENENYYGIALSKEMFSRYYEIASHVTVLINTKKIEGIPDNNKFSRLNIQNFNVVPVSKITSIKGIMFNTMSVRKKIYEEINKVDILITRLPSLIGYMSIGIAKKLKKPYLVEVVGCPFESYWHHSLTGKFFAVPNYLLMKKSLKKAPFVNYVTKEFLQKRYPSNGYTVNCSDVNLPNLHQSILIERQIRINKLTDESTIRLGTTGAIDVKYKGHEFVIKAISMLKKEGFRFEYHIIGGGDESYLKSIAKDNQVEREVKFLGSLAHEKVFEELNKIDVYIQPSLTEGLPRGLIEAMGQACPSIGSRVGGIPELLNPEATFPKGSYKAIYSLLGSINKQWLLKNSGRNFFVAKNYESSEIEDRRKAFYQTIKNQLTILN